jgi:hypothetical protein
MLLVMSQPALSIAEAPQPLEKPDVQILESPWSGGRTIESYYGPVQVLVRVPGAPRVGRSDRIAAGIREAVEQMRHIAAARGANAIASPALEIDPFGESIEIRAGGSAFELRATTPKWPRLPLAAWPCAPWL